MKLLEETTCENTSAWTMYHVEM